jgi:hypothetical protein
MYNIDQMKDEANWQRLASSKLPKVTADLWSEIQKQAILI